MRGRITPRVRLIATVALVVLALPACGGDENGTGGTGGDGGGDGGASTVAITLQEFAVAADPASVPAGSVTFEATNDGPDDTHEFVVIMTDLGPTELPTDKDGVVEETGEGMEVIDEIEGIPVGETQSLTVDLVAGNYVLICNILQEEPGGVLEAHYSEGMRTTFTVE